ncbi:MAG: amidase family protein [Actinomycetota bacterium]
MNPALVSAVEQRRMLLDGEISAVELLDACLDQHDRHNPALNAVVHLELDRARRGAAEADDVLASGAAVGPLHGLPMTVKDCIDWEGTPTTWGDPAQAGNIAADDAAVVAQLRAAGAIVYGKTNVPLFLGEWQTFNRIHGRTDNPWDPTRTPGGSSGGSAVAVATGMSSLEVGSDIGGSIRWPAAYTAAAGLKPSYGLVSQRGHTYPGQPGTVDNNVVGPIARSVADLELMLPVMHEPFMAPAAATQQSLHDFRVGIVLHSPVGEQDDQVTRTIEAAVAALVDAGVRVVAPPRTELLVETHEVGLELGRAAACGPYPPPPAEDLDRYKQGGRDYDALAAWGAAMPYREWIGLNNRRGELRARWTDYFGGADLLLAPVTPTTAPPHDTHRPFNEQTVLVNGAERPLIEQWIWASLANPTYQPSVAFPAGLADDGLPVGMQAVGPFMADRTCLRFGVLAQSVLGHPLASANFAR